MKQSRTENSAAVTFTELGEVRINDAYAVNAMKLERKYLLETLDADKLLYYFHVNAGLTPKASSSYGGKWEGALIGGHTLGHYLSALAQAYATANTPASGENCKTDFLERIDYIVGELKRCQDNAAAAGAKEGFLWGAPAPGADSGNVEAQFDFVEKNQANIFTQAWVPWYTMHKILQGLIDVAKYTGSERALGVAVSLGDWVYNRVVKWNTETQATVLGIEYGGMNDCMYHLYSLTQDGKYAVAAHKFDEEALFCTVRKPFDNYLDGLHANTTIPKILGALNRYITCHGKTVDGEKIDAADYLRTAENFWDHVVKRHTYITGGNSEDEHFGKDGILDAERTNANCETCNTFNMLKLSRMLFTVTGDKKYLDYYENTYYNAIWSSQNPETGMTTYFQPMAAGYFKVYSSPTEHFWCCTGSGMESFTKLNDSIYFQAGNAVYVSLYVSSEYTSDAVSLTQMADLENSDGVKIRINRGATVLRLRKPFWTKSFAVKVNGATVVTTGLEDFISVDVKSGDTVSVTLQKTICAEGLFDSEDVFAFRFGPFVLSAELGTEDMKQASHGVNVSVPAKACGNKIYSVPADSLGGFCSRAEEYFVKDGGKFILACSNGTLTYSYHFRQHTQRYAIYLKFTAGETGEEEETRGWQEQDRRQVGYGQNEPDLQDNGSTGVSSAQTFGSTRYANAGGSFTYSAMRVIKGAQNRLVVYFAKEDNGKTIIIRSGNTTLCAETLGYTGGEEMYAAEIPLPETLVNASDGTLPVTFSGMGGAQSARLCSYVFTQTYASGSSE